MCTQAAWKTTRWLAKEPLLSLAGHNYVEKCVCCGRGDPLVTKHTGYGLPRLNELFRNEHVLCNELTGHLFNNSRVLLSGIKLTCQKLGPSRFGNQDMLLPLAASSLCFSLAHPSQYYLPPQDEPAASSHTENRTAAATRGGDTHTRPKLLWPGSWFTHRHGHG